jgi:hypothetical protein
MPVAPVTPEQRTLILNLLADSDLTTAQIAEQAAASAGQVAAIRAHITMGTYDRAPPAVVEADEVVDAFETTFGLERDMQAALRLNIEQLERGLKIIDGGHEKTTLAGRIDILAQDASGAVVVIELKSGEAAPEALTQLLGYMGTVERDPGQHVRGILVAGDFHKRVAHASRAVPNVQLWRYRFTFSFARVE